MLGSISKLHYNTLDGAHAWPYQAATSLPSTVDWRRCSRLAVTMNHPTNPPKCPCRGVAVARPAGPLPALFPFLGPCATWQKRVFCL